MTYDVITFGETMLRLTPPDLLQIEQTSHYESCGGGSESNVAVGLARLGLKVTWCSRMTDNPIGHSIVNSIRAHGVDISHVIWTKNDRVGIYFYEAGRMPRSGMVIYDRANSAMSKIQPSDLPGDLFQKNKTKILHLSGITLAISQTAARTALEASKLARKADFLLSFDLNYRSLLWNPEKAVQSYAEIAPYADIVFLPLRDAITLYGTSTNPEDALETLSEQFTNAIIVLTLGAEGAIAKDKNQVISQKAIPAEVVGRLGAGDAFVAGFLYAYLKERETGLALRWGTASAAYKYSIKGEFALLDKQQISQIVDSKSTTNVLR